MMPAPGHIAMVNLPFTDLTGAKRRPVVVLAPAPTGSDDWLVCMISTKTKHLDPNIDELISVTDPDYPSSGLVAESLVRVGRMAIVEKSLLLGAIGIIGSSRLTCIKTKLKGWINTI